MTACHRLYSGIVMRGQAPLQEYQEHTVETLSCDDAIALARKQAELELVGHVVSHDLRAPVRILEGLSEQLAEHPALAADAEGRDLVEAVADESRRLRAMIEGLLEYVRLETFTPMHSVLDANEVAAAALTILEDELIAARITVTCDRLPMVVGHRGRLTRLFLALMDNAIKFRAGAAPAIHLSAREEGAWVEFCVADNGIGMEEEQQDVIYTLFQRLHADDEYAGYGIGLALARKIVEAHGGTLRVACAPGTGSSFYFTLPSVGDAAKERV